MPDLEASLEVDKFCFRKYVPVFIYKLLEVNPYQVHLMVSRILR